MKVENFATRQTRRTLICIAACLLVFLLVYSQASISAYLTLNLHVVYPFSAQFNSLQVTITNSSNENRTLVSWQRTLVEFQLLLDVVRENFINNMTSSLQCSNFTRKRGKIILSEFDEERIYYRIILQRLPCDVAAYHDVNWSGTSINDTRPNHKTLANLPVQYVFQPFASEPVCDTLPERQRAMWKGTISCNSSQTSHNYNETIPLANDDNKLLQSRPYHDSMEFLYSYVNLFRNASINYLGSVRAKGSVTVLPVGCKKADTFQMDNHTSSSTIYDEVFIMAHLWAHSYFHATVASLPRLAPYVEFLQRHPHIRLHVAYGEKDKRTASHMSANLAALGIDPKRAVSGDIRAQIAYLPRATPCNLALVPEVQILSWRFRNYIVNSLREVEHLSVVMIIREAPKGTRNMARSIYASIIHRIEILLVNGPLKLELFDDRHRLSHSDTLRMFYRARIVIGIHGAGLANMIYSRPGTQIIEMLCQPPDLINLCYVNLALVLGHRYHAFPVSSCVKHAMIDVDQFMKTVAFYIHASLVDMK